MLLLLYGKLKTNQPPISVKNFTVMLMNGYTYAQALQKAKTDLLNDASMSQFHSPVYWSHLIFIGDVQTRKIICMDMDNCWL